MATFGEKLKEARLKAGFTQESFAERINVSRSAVAKWESDKGLPEISNLQYIAESLGVSIDQLLSTDGKISMEVIRTPYDLRKFNEKEKLSGKVMELILKDTFPNHKYNYLGYKKKLSKKQNIVDFTFDLGFSMVTGWLPFSSINESAQLVDMIGKYYFLVYNENEQLLARITNEFVESRKLVENVEVKMLNKFMIGPYEFTVSNEIK